MPAAPTIEELWARLADYHLDPCYYGQIIITVRAGTVIEVEQRQTFKPPRQKPKPKGEGEDRSE